MSPGFLKAKIASTSTSHPRVPDSNEWNEERMVPLLSVWGSPFEPDSGNKAHSVENWRSHRHQAKWQQSTLRKFLPHPRINALLL
jgi:hypothetical protein